MREVRLERVYPQRSEVVWRALTEPEAMRTWLGARGFRAEVGHRFTVPSPSLPGLPDAASCAVLSVDAPKKLVLAWQSGPLNTTVTFEVESIAGGTRVRLAQSGFDQPPVSAFAPLLLGVWREKLEVDLLEVVMKLAKTAGAAGAAGTIGGGAWLAVAGGVAAVAVIAAVVAMQPSPESADPGTPAAVVGDDAPEPRERPDPGEAGPELVHDDGVAEVHTTRTPDDEADLSAAPLTVPPTRVVPPPRRPAPLVGSSATKAVPVTPVEATITIYDDNLPRTLNPLFARTVEDRHAHELIFDRLFYYSVASGDFESRIVKHWEMPESRDEITVWLLPGVSWHDGEPLTGTDLCFTVDALLDPLVPSTGGTRYRQWIAGCEVVADDVAATIRLTGPELDPRARLDFAVLPAHFGDEVLRPDSDFAFRPAGTGPMSGVKGRRSVLLRRVPNAHHQAGISEVSLAAGGDPFVQVRTLLGGGVHGLLDVPVFLQPELEASDRVRLVRVPSDEAWLAVLDTRTGALAEPLVRSGVEAALDRQQIIGLLGVGAVASPLAGPFPSSTAWAAPAVREPRLEGDLDAVGRYLDAAGAERRAGQWTLQGEPIRLRVATLGAYGTTGRELVQHVGNQLQLAGFTVTTSLLSTSDLDRLSGSPALADAVDMLILNHRLTGPSDLSVLLHSRGEHAVGEHNHLGHADPTLDAALDRLESAATSHELGLAAQGVDDLLAATTPAIFLWRQDRMSAWSRHLQGVVITPDTFFTEFDRWTWVP